MIKRHTNADAPTAIPTMAPVESCCGEDVLQLGVVVTRTERVLASYVKAALQHALVDVTLPNVPETDPQLTTGNVPGPVGDTTNVALDDSVSTVDTATTGVVVVDVGTVNDPVIVMVDVLSDGTVVVVVTTTNDPSMLVDDNTDTVDDSETLDPDGMTNDPTVTGEETTEGSNALQKEELMAD